MRMIGVETCISAYRIKSDDGVSKFVGVETYAYYIIKSVRFLCACAVFSCSTGEFRVAAGHEDRQLHTHTHKNSRVQICHE